jgi:hypothetical protein
VRHQLQLQQDIQKTVTTKSGIDSAYISIGTHSLAGRHSILAINFRNVHKQFNQSQHSNPKNGKDNSHRQLIKETGDDPKTYRGGGRRPVAKVNCSGIAASGLYAL